MAYVIVLLHKDRLFRCTLEGNDTVSFGSHKRDTVYVSDFCGSQISVSGSSDGVLLNSAHYGISGSRLPADTFVELDRSEHTALFVSAATGQSPLSYRLEYNSVVRAGRNTDNNITIGLPFVTGCHFVIRYEEGNFRVEDQGSRNGLYLNGRKIGIAKLKSGDELEILSVAVKLINGTLYFENVGGTLKFNRNSLQEDRSPVEETAGGLLFRRFPRVREALPSESITLAKAPVKGQKYEKGRGALTSLAGSGAMFATSILSGAVSPALLAARAAALVSPIIGAASGKGYDNKRRKQYEQYEADRRERYGEYIEDQKANIESVAEVQRRIETDNNPSPEKCLEIVKNVTGRLWERTPSDDDFLSVRVGMGYEGLCVPVNSPDRNASFEMENDEIRALTEQIIEETRIVDHIPERVDLLKNSHIGLVGAKEKRDRLLKNLVIGIASLHSPQDVGIAALLDKSYRREWEMFRWLPHFQKTAGSGSAVAFDAGAADELLEEIGSEIKERLLSEEHENARKRRLVVLVGAGGPGENGKTAAQLAGGDSSVGLSVIFTADHLHELPGVCRYIIDLNEEPCVYDRLESNKKKFFTPDAVPASDKIDGFSRKMAAIVMESDSRSKGIPDSVTLLDGLGVRTVGELDVLTRWQRSVPYRALEAPVGISAGGKPFYLNIHEKAHGPHGLVAGTTGSGKSELLQTWIISLAICYHPHDVAFVLIDYKGGGMANLLEPLPHVVGKITNLGANIGRSLISLQSEIKRRQRIFDEAGVNHIDKYQRLYRAGKVNVPMPHLIIVADEFAELKKEEPDFMAGLISASRVGRSLGIHLILATQKPGGVVDEQIQSNSHFRLCLKVQDAGDSREMIGRSDAARITIPGRTFIRVGEDEVFDLFQSYWSGAAYTGDQEQGADTEIRLVDDSGRRIELFPAAKKELKDAEDQLSAVVAYICGTAKNSGILRLPGPWLEDLPETVCLKELAVSGGFNGTAWEKGPDWFRVPVGIFDDPKAQQQGIQYVDFAEEGHYGVYGAPGTGKTAFLKELTLALGMYYAPDEVTIYIIDCAGWSLNAFSGMPHVGDVILDADGEKLDKFTKLILAEIRKRKKLFMNNSVSSLAAFREVSDEKIPAIVIVVDNIVPMFDDGLNLEPFFTTIAREGTSYGIYLVYSSVSTTGVRYKVQQNVKGAVAFELTDRGDYPSVVGRPDGFLLPKIRGRAFYKGNPPMIFQAAEAVSGANEREKAEELKQIIADMNRAWTGKRPEAVAVMPEYVLDTGLLPEYRDFYQIPVGVRYEDVGTEYADVSDQYTLLVTGPVSSGKSRLLSVLSDMMQERFPAAVRYVIDSTGRALSGEKEQAAMYAVNGQPEIGEMIGRIIEELNVRKNAQKKEDLQTKNEEKEYAGRFVPIVILIDDLKEFVDLSTDADKHSMERICRLAQYLGIIVVAAGRLEDIRRYNEIETLTRAIVSQQNAVALEGCPADYSFMMNGMDYQQKARKTEKGSGFRFHSGECSVIKVIKSDS